MTSVSRLVSGTASLAAIALLAACASTSAPPAEPIHAAQTPSAPPTVTAETRPAPKLKQRHPIRYVVKKGDTLWDIASRFLENPWLWPDIWYVNPQIRNPHLIYPGDVIELLWVNGKPRLTLAGTGNVAHSNLPVTHMHPKVRVTPIKKAISTVPLAAIRPFLVRAPIVTEAELQDAPYVLATGDGRLLAGEYRQVYVHGVNKKDGSKWLVVRKGEPLKDPNTGELLGYQSRVVGVGKVVHWGDPATMTLAASQHGVRVGDRLFPYNNGKLPVDFYPHAPDKPISGQIISVLEGVSQVGQYDVVVINRGKDAGLDPGTVLAIYQSGRSVEDPYNGNTVTLPARRAGVLMIFRTFQKVSYGLVMELKKEAHVHDLVKNP